MSRKRMVGRMGKRIIGVAALALTLCWRAGATTVEPMTIEETAHDANSIFVGRVLQVESRWGDASRRWMVTDCTVAVEDAILADNKVQTGRQVVLTFWGGTIGNETQGVADLDIPNVDGRYVLMLAPEGPERGFAPTVGLYRGIFPVNEASLVTDAEGAPLLATATGKVVHGNEAEPGAMASRNANLATFVAYLRTNLMRIKAMPEKPAPQAKGPSPRLMRTFSLQPETAAADSRVNTAASDLPLGSQALAQTATERRDAHGPQAPQNPVLRRAEAEALPSPEQASADYASFGYVDFPINVYPFPSSFGAWYPEDQYQMGKWNYYADVFRVFAPSGTFGWTNNKFEQAGWPSSATLASVYGSGWGATTLGITFYRKSGNRIIEADIALNPAYSWTLDDEAVYNGSSVYGFRQTMTHELGHMLGLDHNFSGMSIMNYSPAVYRAFSVPFMDDAEGARAIYPARVQARTDLGVSLFRSNGSQNWAPANFPSSALAGNNITVSDFHIENVGTATITTPTIEWYLTTERNYSASYRYLETTTFSPALGRFFFYNPASVARTLTIPTSVPGGDYYLGAFIGNDGGAGQGSFPFSNNYSFSRTRIRVNARLTGLSVSPSTVNGGASATGTVSLGSASGPGSTTVSLSSSNPAVVSVPSSVSVAAGTSSRTFTATTFPVVFPTNVTITASNGGVTDTAALKVKAGSQLELSRIAVGRYGGTVDLSATLSRTNNTRLSGKSVSFYVDGSFVGTQTTNASGVATLEYAIGTGLGLGNHTVLAVFAGDVDYISTSDSSTLSVTRANTTITASNVSGAPGRVVSLRASLRRDTDNALLFGKTLVFKVNGVVVGSDATNFVGQASIPYTIPSRLGTGIGATRLDITVEFATDSFHNESDGSAILTVISPITSPF